MRGTSAIILSLACSAFVIGCDDDVGPGSDGGQPPDIAMQVAMPLARFAVIGDYGVDTPNEIDVVKLVDGWRPDYIVTVGDNNYPNGDVTTIDTNIGQYFAQYIGAYTGKFGPGSATNRFWPCLGNHDWDSPTGAQPYLTYFSSLPANKRYYDFAIGNVHLFSVDSDPREPDGIDVASVQAQWLQAALRSAPECFKIVYFHHPAYSSGDPLFTEPAMRWPFADWGATLVLSGHQHQYERLVIGGMTYVVDGLGGALNRFNFATVQPGSLVRYNAEFGALLVEVFDAELQLTFRNTLNQVVDRFVVARDCSAVRVDAGR